MLARGYGRVKQPGFSAQNGYFAAVDGYAGGEVAAALRAFSGLPGVSVENPGLLGRMARPHDFSTPPLPLFGKSYAPAA